MQAEERGLVLLNRLGPDLNGSKESPPMEGKLLSWEASNKERVQITWGEEKCI